MTTVPRTVEALRSPAILVLALAVFLYAGPARGQGGTATPPRTAAQIEQLVAPIALYPDSLLSQVLMASTYPLEVVEAARWSRENSGVTGQALEDAMQKQSWDASLKALTSVPQTLQMMNDKIEWTQQLGDAFLAQQQDVLDAIQRLRARADANGYLKEGEQQKVTRTPAPPRPAATGAAAAPAAPSILYTIESANPEFYYVPIYDPGVVYGAWPYPDNQPFYWYPSGYVASNVFSFAAGVAVGAAVWSHVDWRRNRIDIDVNRYNRFNRTNISNATWVHDPAHRRGVAYRDGNVAQRFGDQGRAAAREGFRGKAEAGRRDLAKQGEAGTRDLAKQGAASQRDLAKKGDAGQRDAAKQGTTGKRDAAKTAGKSKTAAKTKETKASGQTKAAAKSKTAAKAKQAAKPKQAARAKQAGHSQAARPRPASSPQPAVRARAQHSARPAGGGGMRGGGHGGGRRR